MSPEESLHLIVEASLALAGFAGVVNALARRAASELPPLHHMSLVNLLATSLGALFLSLAALVLLSAGADETLTWRLISVAGLCLTLYFALRSVREVGAAVGKEGARRSRALRTINGSLLVVCLVQVGNAVVLGEFWPVFLLLASLFAVGCFSFTQLLFSPRE